MVMIMTRFVICCSYMARKKHLHSQGRFILRSVTKKLPRTTQHILYQQLADFLKKQFYAFMGYDPSMPLSTRDFYALQEEGEKELAQLMELSSADAAGNLVFLSIDRLSSSEIAELIKEMDEHEFTITLHKIKRLTHRRNY